jgi:hypothetical protein
MPKRPRPKRPSHSSSRRAQPCYEWGAMPHWSPLALTYSEAQPQGPAQNSLWLERRQPMHSLAAPAR